jgi:hypothetical protein
MYVCLCVVYCFRPDFLWSPSSSSLAYFMDNSNIIIIVPEQFQNNLNYFSFGQIFENLFVTCAKKIIKLKICKIQLSDLNRRP